MAVNPGWTVTWGVLFTLEKKMDDDIDDLAEDVVHYVWGQPWQERLNAIIERYLTIAVGFVLSAGMRALVEDYTGEIRPFRASQPVRTLAFSLDSRVHHFSFIGFRCTEVNSVPMYQSWLPSNPGVLMLTKLSPARRALFAQLFAHVAREFNWGVNLDGRGLSMYRYYTTCQYFRDYAVQGMFDGVTRGAGEGMKEVYSKLYWSLAGDYFTTEPARNYFSHYLRFCRARRCARCQLTDPAIRQESDASYGRGHVPRAVSHQRRHAGAAQRVRS